MYCICEDTVRRWAEFASYEPFFLRSYNLLLAKRLNKMNLMSQLGYGMLASSDLPVRFLQGHG